MISENDCILVLYTFNKRHRYIPFIDRIVARNIKFLNRVLITNEDVEFSSKVYFNEELDFVPNLLRELKKIKREINPTTILLLLEDLLPFIPIIEEQIAHDVSLVKNSFAMNVSYRTYEFGDIDYNINLDNRYYFQLNKKFKYYCQLQPSIWQLNYLIGILEEQASNGILDPWSFEFHHTNSIHLMSSFRWPNVLGGFYEYGYVNFKSIKPIIFIDLNFGFILLYDFLISRPRYFKYLIKRIFMSMIKSAWRS